jgi:hypothetical protein
VSLSHARIAGVILASLGVVAWAATARTQSQVPGMSTPGAAPVTVVNDVNTRAAQSGAWQVSLAPSTKVALADDAATSPSRPDFLKPGRRYVIAVEGAAPMEYEIERFDHGWVLAVDQQGSRWLNLARVISIREGR